MTTQQTFEDRLLRALQREIGQREGARSESAQQGIGRRELEQKGVGRRETAGPGDGGRDVAGPGAESSGAGLVASWLGVGRRLVVRRRLVLAAGACALAGLAVVFMPGSPADSPAYAVERHGDGTVTLSLLKVGIGPEAQRQLAERLRAEGIHVTIDDLPYGRRCAQPRGELLSPLMYRAFLGGKPSGGDVVVGPSNPSPDTAWRVTLHRGDSLGIENMERKHGGRTPSELFYGVKGKIKPCEPESAS